MRVCGEVAGAEEAGHFTDSAQWVTAELHCEWRGHSGCAASITLRRRQSTGGRGRSSCSAAANTDVIVVEAMKVNHNHLQPANQIFGTACTTTATSPEDVQAYKVFRSLFGTKPTAGLKVPEFLDIFKDFEEATQAKYTAQVVRYETIGCTYAFLRCAFS